MRCMVGGASAAARFENLANASDGVGDVVVDVARVRLVDVVPDERVGGVGGYGNRAERACGAKSAPLLLSKHSVGPHVFPGKHADGENR